MVSRRFPSISFNASAFNYTLDLVEIYFDLITIAQYLRSSLDIAIAILIIGFILFENSSVRARIGSAFWLLEHSHGIALSLSLSFPERRTLGSGILMFGL